MFSGVTPFEKEVIRYVFDNNKLIVEDYDLEAERVAWTMVGFRNCEPKIFYMLAIESILRRQNDYEREASVKALSTFPWEARQVHPSEIDLARIAFGGSDTDKSIAAHDGRLISEAQEYLAYCGENEVRMELAYNQGLTDKAFKILVEANDLSVETRLMLRNDIKQKPHWYKALAHTETVGIREAVAELTEDPALLFDMSSDPSYHVLLEICENKYCPKKALLNILNNNKTIEVGDLREVVMGKLSLPQYNEEEISR